ncbi:MAG: Glu/Leu/Phe/Val dehydrogenase dimerization domain-containing protein [Patescibacteria group bacterium]
MGFFRNYFATSNESIEFKELAEYDRHYKIIELNDLQSGLKGFIAIHRKRKNAPSFGATRLWHYESSIDGARDALRLSRLMSRKAIMAGLPCGGAKGVILAPTILTSEKRKQLLSAYAAEVNKLAGEFITGTDAGLFQEDIEYMRTLSSFFVGFNGNVTTSTALGVYMGIETCFEFLDGESSINGKTFAIQGLGKIGQGLLELIYEKAGTIFVTDAHTTLLEEVRAKFPQVIIVESSEIHKQKVDVFMPCALHHAINRRTVNELQCRMIIGGANNQLEDATIGDLLLERNILYAPDYVVNAGGLISVYDEFEHPGAYDQKRVDAKIYRIKETLISILQKSKENNMATNKIADSIAKEWLLKDD